MKVAGGLLLIVAASSASQDSAPPFKAPVLPTLVRQPSDFVPTGWKLIVVKSGDLNGDKRPDAAVLMRMTDPANIKPVDTKIFSYSHDDTNPYLLAIGFAQSDGYGLAVTNHSLFPDYTAPMHEDTPPDGNSIDVSRGVLTLSFEHLRSNEQFRFRWNGKAFTLIGYDCGSVTGASGEVFGLSANYLTRKARIERGTIDGKSHFWTVRIRPGNRPTLDQNEWEFGWIGQDTDGDDLSC